jgi:hypothetical protein
VLEGLRETPGDNSAAEATVGASIGEIAARFPTYG